MAVLRYKTQSNLENCPSPRLLSVCMCVQSDWLFPHNSSKTEALDQDLISDSWPGIFKCWKWL